jgi:hypothetical protein
MDWYNTIFCGMSYALADMEALKFNSSPLARLFRIPRGEVLTTPMSTLRKFINDNVLLPMVETKVKSIIFSNLIKHLILRFHPDAKGNSKSELYRMYRSRVSYLVTGDKGFELQRCASHMGDRSVHLVNLNVQ